MSEARYLVRLFMPLALILLLLAVSCSGSPRSVPAREYEVEAPVEEPAEEIVEEIPDIEPEEEDVPVEEPVEIEVVEEEPAEEEAAEEEAGEEEPAEEEIVAEEPAEEVAVEEEPAEEVAVEEEVAEEAPVEEPVQEVVAEEAPQVVEVEAEEPADTVVVEEAVQEEGIVVDGSGHLAGPLPVIFYVPVSLDGQDIYPIGEGSFTLFALLDSGSPVVGINDQPPPNRVAGLNWEKSDADHLKINNVESVNLRLSGLNTRRPQDGLVPMGSPGTENAAQVEVQSIAVAPADEDVTLIGAPVINQLIIVIDYTTMISDPALDSVFKGVRYPHIDLFWPGDLRVPSPFMAVQLEKFGDPSGGGGQPTRGSRYWLRGASFQEGNNLVYDARDGFDLLFDTGTTLTLVNDRLAAALGLSVGDGDYNCFGGSNNGYYINRVSMDAYWDKQYIIQNAAVCWQDNAVRTGDAVIGSNFFDQVQIVLNGPGDLLGIMGESQAVGGATPSDQASDTGQASTDPIECTAVEKGGHCWHLGRIGDSCEDVCAHFGGYDEATREYAGSDGSSRKCKGVLEEFGISFEEFIETKQSGIGCFISRTSHGGYFGSHDELPTTASATYKGRQRVCACGW